MFESILKLDYKILMYYKNKKENKYLSLFLRYISTLGNKGFICFLTIFLLFLKSEFRFYSIILGFAIFLNVLIVNIFLKNIIARERPFKKYNYIPRIAEPRDYAFPSGHTSSIFVLSTISAYILTQYNLYNYIILLIIFSVIMAYSRIYLLVHYLSDVIFGMMIGIMIGMISIYFANFIKRMAISILNLYMM